MSDYIPQYLRPEEFVAVHKNDLTFVRNEIDKVHAALACLLELPNKDHDGMTALLQLLADKTFTLRDNLTSERMENTLHANYVEIRAIARESSHAQ